MASDLIGGVDVDTLVVGYWVDLRQEWVDQVRYWQRELKERRDSRGQVAGVGAGAVKTGPLIARIGTRADHVEFEVQGGQGHPYSLTLVGADVSMRLAVGVALVEEARTPSVYVEFRSAYLAEHGWHECHNQVVDFLARNVGSPRRTTVSRVDLKVDIRTDEIDVGWCQADAVVTRARSKEDGGGYDDAEQAHRVAAVSFGEFWSKYNGEYFNGYRLGSRGRSGVFFRLYDKFRQSETVEGAAHVREHWVKRCGWDGRKFPRDCSSDARFASIWRAEFQIGAEVLQSVLAFVDPNGVEVHAGTIEGLFHVLSTGSLWSYCTREWLRFVEPLQNWRSLAKDPRGRYLDVTRRESRPTQGWWRLVQGADVPPVRRDRVRLPRVSRQQVQQALGCLASYIASESGHEREALDTVLSVFRELPKAVAERQFKRAMPEQIAGGQFQTGVVYRAFTAAADAFAREVMGAAQRVDLEKSGVRMPFLRGPESQEHLQAMANEAASKLWRRNLRGGQTPPPGERKAMVQDVQPTGDDSASGSSQTRGQTQGGRAESVGSALAAACEAAGPIASHSRLSGQGRPCAQTECAEQVEIAGFATHVDPRRRRFE